MKIPSGVLAALLAVVLVYHADAQVPALKRWSAAVYHGLVVGTSSRDDVLRVLGKPKAVGMEQDTGLPTMMYTVSDPVLGTLIVYTKKGILDGMTLLPKNHLTKGDISRLFGPDYAVVGYSTDDCFTEAGTAPIYEAPDGPIQHLEYRDRGLAAVLHNSDVTAVVFVSGPFGPTHSLCAEGGRNSR